MVLGNVQSGSDYVLKRISELKHAEDIRALYEERLEKVNHLYAEMASLKLILEEQTKSKNRQASFAIRCYHKLGCCNIFVCVPCSFSLSISRKEKLRKKSSKRSFVRPIQDRLRPGVRCQIIESPAPAVPLSDKAIFLELEQDSDRTRTVMRPLPANFISPRSSFQVSSQYLCYRGN